MGITATMINPLKLWRQNQEMTRKELAEVSGLTEYDIAQIEQGDNGIPGELQDFLAKRGVNVSELASEQSAFIADMREKKTA